MKEADEDWDDGDDAFFSLPGTGEPLSILVKTAEWYQSKHSGWFASWSDDNYRPFVGAESADAEGMELRLEWTAIHEQFTRDFEQVIEEYIAAEGAGLREFNEECVRLLDGKQISVFDDKVRDGSDDGTRIDRMWRGVRPRPQDLGAAELEAAILHGTTFEPAALALGYHQRWKGSHVPLSLKTWAPSCSSSSCHVLLLSPLPLY